MHETEENMNDLPKKITELVAELKQCRKRALEIELQLSVIDEALRKARTATRQIGRPRKVKYAAPVDVEEFDGNTAL